MMLPGPPEDLRSAFRTSPSRIGEPRSVKRPDRRKLADDKCTLTNSIGAESTALTWNALAPGDATLSSLTAGRE
jgi:hypothetical protein